LAGGLAASVRAGAQISAVDVRSLPADYHLFQPLLSSVATGSLSPGEIAAPLRGVFSRQKKYPRASG